MKKQILKILYKVFLRGWIKKQIDDPKRKWDDHTMKALDALFG